MYIYIYIYITTPELRATREMMNGERAEPRYSDDEWNASDEAGDHSIVKDRSM